MGIAPEQILALAALALGSMAACSIAEPTASGARETAWIAGFALTIILAARLRRRGDGG